MRHHLCNVRCMHLIVLVVSVLSINALVPRNGIGIASHDSERVSNRPSIRTPILPHGRQDSALFWGWNREKSRGYNIYGEKGAQRTAAQNRKPKIVEKYNIYGKRPPPPPDGKVRPLLNIKKRKEQKHSVSVVTEADDEEWSEMIDANKGFTAQELNGRPLLSIKKKKKSDIPNTEHVDDNSLQTMVSNGVNNGVVNGVVNGEKNEKSSEDVMSNMTSIGKEVVAIEESIEQLAPLERQSFRLQGFDPYILVSVLTAGESFDVVSSYHPDWEGMANKVSIDMLTQQDMYTEFLLVIGAASTLLGAYSAVTFSLTVLYGKTALGLEKDEAYYEFLDNTGLQRLRAFLAFTFSLGLFCIIVFLELLEKTPAVFRLPIALVATTFLYFGRSEYRFVTDMAAPIFQEVSNANKDNDEEEEGVSIE